MYGGLGVNAEQMGSTNQFAYTAGVGLNRGLGFAVGARYYFAPTTGGTTTGRGWRATAAVGNRLAHSGDDDVSFGLMASVGYRWNKWDADFDMPSALISVGYRFIQ